MGSSRTATSGPRRDPDGAGHGEHRAPSTRALLDLQRMAGNQAVGRLLGGADAGATTSGPGSAPLRGVQAAMGASGAATPIFVQRLPGRSGKKPKQTHEKARAKEMTSEEGLAEKARVEDQVHACIAHCDALIEGGTSPEEAARVVFDAAPPDVRRWLPLHDEFDIAKQDVDRVRREEGGLQQARVAGRLTTRAQELGYRAGVGDPMEAKPADVEKELKADVAFRRQMERRAERKLLGERAVAESTLRSATATGDGEAVAEARRRLAALQGPAAVEAKVTELLLDAAAAVDERTREKVEARKAELKVARISDAEKWRLREKAKKSVREKLEAGLDDHLIDAGSAAGGVGDVGLAIKRGAAASSGAKGTTKLSASQLGIARGTMGSVGDGLKLVGKSFADVVKFIKVVNDIQSDNADKDAALEAAGYAGDVVKQAVSAAHGSLQAALQFNEALRSDPGFAAAIPGLGIAVAVIGFVGNVIAVVAPTERFYHTAASWSSASDAGSAALAGALGRTTVENAMQVTSEVVGATANGIRVAAGIAELASAGGFGAPAGVKLGATALELANGAAQATHLEYLRSRTQAARKAGALQIEGSGRKLVTTDIGYAVDVIALAAQRALAKRGEGQASAPEERAVIALVGSYGVGEGELQRLSLGEIHERMLDKLDQDDEQLTAKMQLQEGFESLKDGLASLAGGGKDKPYQDLDSYAREMTAKAQDKAEMTGGDKVKAKFTKAGGYARTAVTAPAKVTKLGDMASEKAEKVKRLREIKNQVNYKERSDRGAGFEVSEFGADLDGSIQKLRRFIVATQPPDRAALYLKELNTLAEQQKITDKVGQINVGRDRDAEKVSDRVISPGLIADADGLTFGEVRDRLAAPDLGAADREYLRQLLAEKVFG